jgi:hypothetical protein
MSLLTLSDFKASANGRRIGALIEQPATIGAMEQLSRQGRPAVLAIDRALAGEVALDDVEKRHVGRWVRDVLGDRGWRPRKRLHFRSGRIFSSGAVYDRPQAPRGEVAGEVAMRVAKVQEMVRAFRAEDYGVDDFLRDKRAEAARDS